MKGNELSNTARSFLGVKTCYLKGFWGQYLSRAEYDRVLKMYPDNAKYNNSGLIGTDVFAFDCICFIKAILGGCTTQKRISYAQMAANPVGDCRNDQFYDMLYDCCSPGYAKPGYALATTKHAALYVGNGQWIDANFTSNQNGVALHTGFSGTEFKCGKIPGISYEDDTPIIDTERAILTSFCDWLVDSYLKDK